ncbi:Hypothetical_protein [Hexamita inflata]|uniref:Hypothetical_protein n=1 Tax=Hexamita inflata TaxID=28002 RepID=A0AA86N5E1_9EUKA|nr:Hypothetical protein HINF_LOCUS743 [Hexamita inflata]
MSALPFKMGVLPLWSSGGSPGSIHPCSPFWFYRIILSWGQLRLVFRRLVFNKVIVCLVMSFDSITCSTTADDCMVRLYASDIVGMISRFQGVRIEHNVDCSLEFHVCDICRDICVEPVMQTNPCQQLELPGFIIRCAL